MNNQHRCISHPDPLSFAWMKLYGFFLFSDNGSYCPRHFGSIFDESNTHVDPKRMSAENKLSSQGY